MNYPSPGMLEVLPLIIITGYVQFHKDKEQNLSLILAICFEVLESTVHGLA